MTELTEPQLTLRSIEFRVHSHPAPQGSKNAFHHKQSGKIVMRESSKRVKPWRQAVGSAAEDAMGGEDAIKSGRWVTMDGPVALSVTFTFPRPASHYGTGRNAAILKPSAPRYPTGKNLGDLSKLIRATEDALTDVGLWTDDCLVVDIRTTKVYPGHSLLALSVPGAVIGVRQVYGGTNA